MPGPTYTLDAGVRGTGHDPSTLYTVRRDGVLVAKIYAYPTHVLVSMRPIAWAGKQPMGYPKNPDGALFFDFVSKEHTASEALPECIERVEKCIAWREAHA